MNKTLLTIASAAVIAIGVGAVSVPAYAFLDDNSCGGKNSCDDNSVTNKGGKGGDGGTAIQGQQQGIFGSGNSENDNRNTNFNTNLNTNRQDQDQDQSQGQGQLQGQSQTGVNVQGQSTDNANNSDQEVTIEGDVYEAAKIPVATAYSAPLTSAEDTCMGSTSGGFQGMSFGVSVGSTWRDEDCVRRKDSRIMFNMGFKNIALARMCQKDDNRLAVEAAGGACPGTEASATPMAAAAVNTATIVIPVGSGSINTTTINNTIGR